MMMNLRILTYKVQHGTGQIEFHNALSRFESKIIVFKYANGETKLIDINMPFNVNHIEANGGKIECAYSTIDIDTDKLNWN